VLMQGISEARSRAGVTAIEEVNAAVRQMDEMTQHNAALVEETNAAIEQTEQQATALDRIVDIFAAVNLKTAATILANNLPAPKSPGTKTAGSPRSAPGPCRDSSSIMKSSTPSCG
jgi:methyl-accepting chemotaxis protein